LSVGALAVTDHEDVVVGDGAEGLVSSGGLEQMPEDGYNKPMAESDNIVLQYLRRFEEKLDRVIVDLHDVKVRLTGVEESIVGVQRRIDRVEERLERIERRLTS
jgi:hypothetical protein